MPQGLTEPEPTIEDDAMSFYDSSEEETEDSTAHFIQFIEDAVDSEFRSRNRLGAAVENPMDLKQKQQPTCNVDRLTEFMNSPLQRIAQPPKKVVLESMKLERTNICVNEWYQCAKIVHDTPGHKPVITINVLPERTNWTTDGWEEQYLWDST